MQFQAQKVEEGQFRHPVSKKLIIGVRMDTGLKFKPNYLFVGRTDWAKCPKALVDGKTVLQCPNTLWIIPSSTPEKLEKTRPS